MIQYQKPFVTLGKQQSWLLFELGKWCYFHALIEEIKRQGIVNLSEKLL